VNNQIPLASLEQALHPHRAISLRSLALASAVALIAWPSAAQAQFFWDLDNDGPDVERSYVEPPPAPRPQVKHTRKAQKPAVIKEAAKPQGPVLISISIEEQRLKVYDSNGLYAETPISTGMRGHSTPMGVFSIIGKKKFHRSNIYSGAPMPYMQRITWSGIALHAGVLPGYPASHGCIRMPMNFATRMYGWTRMGSRVVIAPGQLSPVDFEHPLLFTRRPEPKLTATSTPAPNETGTTATDKQADAPLPDLKPGLNLQDGPRQSDMLIRIADTGDTVLAATPAIMRESTDTTAPVQPNAATPAPATDDPAASTVPVKRTGHIAAFISRKEGKIFMRQNFEPLFEAPVTIADGGPLGTHVFTLRADKDDPKAFKWSVVSLPPRQAAASQPHKTKRGERTPVEVALPSPSVALDRITVPADAMDRIADAMMPGDSLTVSDLGLGGETGRGTDFIVPLR